MANIEAIVKEIVARCQYEDIEVSDALATFVAKTVVEEDASTFCVEKKMTDDDITKLIHRSVDFLSQKDSPALETMKMQLDFDIAYIQYEEEIAKKVSAKEKKVRSMHRTICSLQPASSGDFETLTTLYKNIFSLLMVHSNMDTATDRNVEREVAAALESVFPRIGLKAFVSLPEDEKVAQLKELGEIVDGIRLFNRELGKGGAGMTLTAAEIRETIQDLGDELLQAIQYQSEVCSQYTDVLIYFHHHKPDELTKEQTRRLQEELSNRRQFLSCLQSLQEDVTVSSHKINNLLSVYEQQLSDLRVTVGSRSSVSKEVVYPMFEAIARTWRELAVEHDIVLARIKSRDGLMCFKNSYSASLSPDSQWLQDAHKVKKPSTNELFHDTNDTENNVKISEESTRRRVMAAQIRAAEKSQEAEKEEKEQDVANAMLVADNDEPVRLSVDSTPEFMQLPLEYQGYCPWTIINRDGLLLPGDPALGVVRYQNSFNVFVNERALQAFMHNPSKYTDGIVSMAMERPQFIHLLRLQDSFPETALANLVKNAADFEPRNRHPLAAPAEVRKVDASTATPVHFVEKNLDFNYEWNEWALRRRALKVANLRKCATISTQTGLSNFRKEIDTQVYLADEHATQTATSRGTHPKKTITYLAGLRGDPATTYSKKDVECHEEEADEARAAMISYTYDLN